MRILFLTQRLPYAPNRGDRVRTFHIVQLLRTFAEVDLVSFVHDREEESHRGELLGLANVSTLRVNRHRNTLLAAPQLFTQVPLTHLLLNAPSVHAALVRAAERRPDVVLAFGSGMARFCLEAPLLGIPFVLDMVDADSQKWAELAKKTRGPLSWIYQREAACLSRFERRATAEARYTTVVNERESTVLRAIAPSGNIRVIPNGVDVAALQPLEAPGPSSDVVFCGVMNYPPNEEAAIWLAEAVWPLVRRERPDARLLLVGASPTSRVQGLASDRDGVLVTGSVPRVTPYLWGAAVSAAPLLTARGIQNKVLEAVAAGLPAVVTTAVSNGLPAEVMPACTVADDPGDFARGIVESLGLSPTARRERAALARLSGLTWDAQLAPFRALLEDARRARS